MSKIKFQGNASGTGVLTITSPNTNNDRTITLPDEDVTLGGGVDGIVSSANATAMTITSDEKIGIGTTSPSEPLHVQGSGNSTKIRIQNTKTGTTTGAELEMVSEDGTWQLGQGRGSLHDGDDEDFHIYNSGTKLWIKKTNGNVYIPSGNLVLGSGLTIGGTGAANTLDDYEEGTFAVTLSASGGQSASNNCRYTKIGNMVTVDLSYDTTQPFWNVQGSTNASVTITSNLPFTPLGTGSFVSGITRSIKVSGRTENESHISIGWQHNSATMYLGDGRGNYYSVPNDVVKENTQSYVVIQGSFTYMTS